MPLAFKMIAAGNACADKVFLKENLCQVPGFCEMLCSLLQMDMTNKSLDAKQAKSDSSKRPFTKK